MEDKLRAYMDHLFREVKPTKKAVELKEEILQNLCDKYRDLVAEGKSPEAAYNIAVAGIGDPAELLSGLKEEVLAVNYSKEEIEKSRRKSAILVMVAVMLYITCVIPVLVEKGIVGISLMFVMVAVATGLLIYNNMTKLTYVKNEDTLVEDFREWQDQTSSDRNVRRAISSAIWAIAVVVYVLVSFSTHAWHITWVIFLIATAVEAVVKAVFEWKR